ncbi:ComEA family DNA-binding protein [Noviluteimonas gilva]|uniref:Competence protein ComEA n=1 Tax=Noviluteimonas gilva TaxID=2682097 RepID=A0A7C9HNS7_9GAMM|nr:ComEA family DNA-binding protein [Lysobacter gilvus]MUV15595.1 competence protein ComEA [Lysobacter gilvus]
MHSFVKTTTAALHAVALSILFAGAAHAAESVDINTADAKTIDRVLVNIGPSKAEAIVAHREANGPYKSLEQLAKVKGIGLKTVEKNRDRIQLGASAKGSAKPATAAAAP